MTETIILKSTTGESSEFGTPDQRIKFKLEIIGTASQTIQVFVDTGIEVFNASIFLQIVGLTGSGATIALKAKLDNIDSEFSDTGRIFSQDYAGFFNELRTK
jgi:hypothetical protein